MESIRLHGVAADGRPRTFYNNSDLEDAACYQGFLQMVQALVHAGADLRCVTVLDPVARR